MAIKVSIIGSGFGAYGLLPAFNKVKGCEVQSICAEKSEKLQKYWKDKNPDKIYTDWKQMLKKEKPDAVAIAVVPKHQYKIAKYAFANRIAVFAEKPLTTSKATGLELCKLAKEKNLPNMVDFIFPEIPEWIEVKKMIAKSAIGKVIAINIDWNFLSYDLKHDIDSWKTDVKQGGGAIAFFFSHIFYYMENFMGTIETFDCLTSTSKRSKNDGETFVGIIAKFKNGCVGTARLNIGHVGLPEHSIKFQGEKGTILLQNNSAKVVDNFKIALENQKRIKRIKPAASFGVSLHAFEDPRVKAVGAIAARFIQWCDLGVPSKLDFQDGLRVQELIEEARILSLKFYAKPNQP